LTEKKTVSSSGCCRQQDGSLTVVHVEPGGRASRVARFHQESKGACGNADAANDRIGQNKDANKAHATTRAGFSSSESLFRCSFEWVAKWVLFSAAVAWFASWKPSQFGVDSRHISVFVTLSIQQSLHQPSEHVLLQTQTVHCSRLDWCSLSGKLCIPPSTIP
jgi:hypothetical protein